MKKIFLDDIEEGMVLGSNQINKFGQILLSKGTKINKNHLKILKTWGVNSILVDDLEGQTELSEGDQKLKSDIEKQLKVRMLFEPSNIYEVDMLRATVHIKLRSGGHE